MRLEDIPIILQSETPRCVHRNELGNCLLCGTKPMRERKPDPWRTRTPRYVGPSAKSISAPILV